MTRTVLILGASGKIGVHSAEAFWNAGWTIRRYERGTDMVQAAMGCDVIVNGLNPPNYHNWAETIPAITAQVIAAAKASGASVIIPGNVYNFGDTPGVWGANTPQRPCSRKGQIRVDMERAYRDSGVQTIVLRAGNFLDPNRQGDVFSMLMTKDIAKGRLTRLGDPDAMQPYAYLPDWARAAEALASRRAGLTAFEDIPFAGHAFSMTDLRAHLQRLLSRDIRITSFPWWSLTLAAPFWELAREFREMRYLFETSHQLDGTRLRGLLPELTSTPIDEVLLACLPREVHPHQSVRPGQEAIVAQ